MGFLIHEIEKWRWEKSLQTDTLPDLARKKSSIIESGFINRDNIFIQSYMKPHSWIFPHSLSNTQIHSVKNAQIKL